MLTKIYKQRINIQSVCEQSLGMLWFTKILHMTKLKKQTKYKLNIALIMVDSNNIDNNNTTNK